MTRKKLPPPPAEPEPPKRRRRGEGSIITLPDGSLLARAPANVDKRRPSREFPPGHRADAEAWLDAIVHPRPAEPAAPLDVTLGEWAATWLETYVEPIAPSTTARRYKHSLKQLAPLYPVPLRSLRPSALQAVIGEISQRLAAATVQDAVGVWRRCLEAAVDDELLDRNPARRLTVPKAPPRQVKRHVTQAEVAALWPAIVGVRFEAAFALLLGCGLRIGEVLGLHWSNVDLANGRAWIQHQWTDHQMRDLPKGRNPHWITLPARVRMALVRHRQRQGEGAVLVMQSPYGARRRRNGKPPGPRPWSPDVISKDLTAIVKGLEITRFTPHAARRGLVTALLDGGASPAIVAERVGHTDPSTTLKSYAGRSDEARARADALVEQYLGGPEGDLGTESAR